MELSKLAEELRDIREIEMQRSRDWVANKIGVHAATLVSWEKGHHEATLGKLNKWVEALGYELVLTLKKK